MLDKLKNLLGFPYPSEYEEGYNRDTMKSMHKPLLIAVVATLLMVTWLASVCIFWPDAIAPPEYVDGLLTIHFIFMVFTMLTLLFTVAFRRQLFQFPKMHVALCNTYAVGICLWSSVLSAYADYSAAVYTAFVYVMICVSMVSMFKPLFAVISYTANYLVYYILVNYFRTFIDTGQVQLFYNAALAAALGMVICIAFYRFRTHVYYDRQIISKQLKQITDINKRLERMIHIDNLTGFFNRRYYEEILPREIQSIEKTKPFCCMMLDIDYFKSYNDNYGHPSGDDCLREVASLIKEVVPQEGSYTVRYGGEEFFVVAVTPSVDHALKLAEAVCKRIRDAYIPHSKSPFGRVTISCGLVFCHKGETWDLDKLTQSADKALYKSKESGRDQVSVLSL